MYFNVLGLDHEKDNRGAQAKLARARQVSCFDSTFGWARVLSLTARIHGPTSLCLPLSPAT